MSNDPATQGTPPATPQGDGSVFTPAVDSPPATEPTSTTATEPFVPTEPAGPWHSVLPEDLANNPTLSRYKTQEEALRGLVHAQALIGRKRAQPDEGDVEGWNQFYNDLGRPANPEGYEFVPPETFPKEHLNDEMRQSFGKWAHEMGLSQKQAQGLYGKFLDYVREDADAFVTEFKGRRDQTETAMKEQWGDKYPALIGRASTILNEICSPEEAEFIKGGGGVVKEFVSIILKLTDRFGESPVVGGQVPQDVAGIEGINKRLQEIEQHPEFRSASIIGKNLRSERTRLYEQRSELQKRAGR